MYLTDNIMILCGEDFSWNNATVNSAMLEIFEYFIGNMPNYTVKFSTVSEYNDALFKGNYEFPVFGGDFLPYIDYHGENTYNYSWTGFYTTRPYLKSRIVETKKLIRATEIVQSLVTGESFVAYGDDVGTHHDAFTGTCRHEVFLDYIRRIDEDYVHCLDSIADAFFKLIEPSETSDQSTALMIPYRVMILFNPINQKVNRMIHFMSKTPFVEILDNDGHHFETQSIPYNQTFEIYFKTYISSLGFKVLFVRECMVDSESSSFPSVPSFKRLIHNGKIGVEFNEGLISTIYDGQDPHHFNTRIMGYNTSMAGTYILYPNVTII